MKLQFSLLNQACTYQCLARPRRSEQQESLRRRPQSREDVRSEQREHDDLLDGLLDKLQPGNVFPVDGAAAVHDLVADHLHHLGIDVLEALVFFGDVVGVGL